MSTKHTLPPMQRSVLLYMLSDPEKSLSRVAGGYYCPTSLPHPVFTSRTVKAMARDGLVKMDEPLCTTRVDFTDEGMALAMQLHEAEQVQAGAA